MSKVSVTRSASSAVVTIGDGRRRNALGSDDWTELTHAMTRLGADPDVHVIVLTGQGNVFCSGSDLNEWLDADAAEVCAALGQLERCFRTIEELSVPVVAAVEDAAIGAGCQLALACDVTVLSQSARVGMPVARLGILPSPAFVARLSTRAGSAVASDLYLTGRLLSAEEALRAGLVTRVVPPGEALASARAVAAQIVGFSSAAVESVKSVVRSVSRTHPGCAGSGQSPAVEPAALRSAVQAFLTHPRPA